jgi:large subunit ribosomal protein L4
MAALTAPIYGQKGSSTEHQLDDAIYGVEIKAHLVHEAVRAESNARRAGTAQTRSRGMVSGGRSKPWRQKGTGRARQGTIRAPQFEGGGHAFAKVPRTFEQKVNRKVVKAALRSALASHANAGSLALIDAAAFDAPSTALAKSVLDGFGAERPVVVVCTEDEQVVARSFRNLDRVAVVQPTELEIGAVVWARTLVVSQAALPTVEARAR